MFAILLSSLILIQPNQNIISLNDIQTIAFNDLQTLNKNDYLNIRYLSLHAIPLNRRNQLITSLIYTLNATSFRSKLSNPVIILDKNNAPILLRINLSDISWDLSNRSKRIGRLKARNVDITSFTPDIWELLTQDDYYFQTNSLNSKNEPLRGWLDPGINEQLRTLTYSSRAILNGYQILNHLLLEPAYSQALLLPSKEADLYKAFGIDQTLIDNDPQLKKGGATLDSIVALHNRELQLIPSLYGKDNKFIWRTFDFNKDATGNKSVLENFVGSVKHDGREIIGSLPNGLHWYYLANAAGTQVNVVPQDIAIDQREVILDPNAKVPLVIKDRSVLNSYKCISCHESGINSFNDVIALNVLKPKVGLGIFNKVKDPNYLKNNDFKEAIEDYYLSNINREITSQQINYVATIKQCNGLDNVENAYTINNLVEDYQYKLITPIQAQLEMCVSANEFQILCRNSANPYLVLLANGQPIRRAAFEKAFYDALTVKIYPWDKK